MFSTLFCCEIIIGSSLNIQFSDIAPVFLGWPSGTTVADVKCIFVCLMCPVEFLLRGKVDYVFGCNGCRPSFFNQSGNLISECQRRFSHQYYIADVDIPAGFYVFIPDEYSPAFAKVGCQTSGFKYPHGPQPLIYPDAFSHYYLISSLKPVP